MGSGKTLLVVALEVPRIGGGVDIVVLLGVLLV